MESQAGPKAACSAAVASIADDGVARSGCMDANLMRTASEEHGLDQAHSPRMGPPYEPRRGGLAINGGGPGSIKARIARDDGMVAALDCPGLECPRNRWVGPLVYGEQHQPTCGGIEPMVQTDIRKSLLEHAKQVRLVLVSWSLGGQPMGLVRHHNELVSVPKHKGGRRIERLHEFNSPEARP